MSANRPKPAEEDPQGTGTIAAQSRALDATRQAAGALGAQTLLSRTGPLAELKAAERKGILDTVRRTLILKKGRGVAFEAQVLANLQEAGERFDLRLTARLATASNDPRADLVVQFLEEEIELQLKTGSDEYIKAAIKARKEGTLLVVPKDIAEETWAKGTIGSLTFDDVPIDMPSNRDLAEHTERCLDRMGRGESALSAADIAKRALSDALIDGIVAVVVDMCMRKLTNPRAPIDWSRTAKSLIRTGATSALASYVAGVNTKATMQIACHAIDASKPFRAARVAACVVPHVLDTAFDLRKLYSGQLSTEGFLRNVSGNAGAATAEHLLFPFMARLAARCGPLGIFVIIVGGAIIAKLGDTVGWTLFDALSWIPSLPGPAAELGLSLHAAVQSRVARAVNVVQSTAIREARRRQRLGRRRLSEEARCGRRHHARGMCSRHYQLWWRRQRRFSWRLS